MHSTVREVNGFGTVLSNGLVVASGDEALLVDAGWGEDPQEDTRRILAETQQTSGATVRRAVFSHHHADSVEGINALRQTGIPTFASSMTAELMDASGWGRPDSLLGDGDVWTFGYGDRQLEVFYAGPGHTVDNVVVFVPSARVLYTGCLVRPGESGSLGNTADADIDEWAESVARVRERYRGRVDIVVPSHGAPGGPELLDHTIELVEAHRGRPVGG
ncbi:MAG: CphA family subclass B2 metallo-beta-lactamase [Rubricoccaceae bacterium]